MPRHRRSRPLMAVAATILILAGVATALLAYVAAPGAILSIDLLAVWLVGELLRPTRRAR